MARLLLFGMLVGLVSAHLLNVPKSQISILARNTALLSASLNFSTQVPKYFQVRWHFVTGSQLVLMLKADNCLSESVSQHWRDSCGISIQKTQGYRHRAELSSKDVSLVLQDVRAEDSGIYCITFLALDVVLSANIELTVTEGNDGPTNQSEIPSKSPDLATPKVFVSEGRTGGLFSATNKKDATLLNIIQLSLGGLVLCFLVMIIAEHISFTYCKEKQTRGSYESETSLHQAEQESNFQTRPNNSYLFVEVPVTDDQDSV